ncbi:helix-turn-helix domain-containing protein [Microbacterium sp. NPDC076911]|uniref:helix-turn-helix domain-containing protein n=1 Tax=Microbacterium sp. NPDC076911 TaxID=3154958 RepID=UPI003446CA9C
MTSPNATSRERILANALSLFAARGADAVSVRDIAAAAGVSPALILHHFGSRERLRQEVDESVIATFDYLLDAEATTASVTTASVVELMTAGLPPGSPLPAYVRQLVLTNSPAGSKLFKRWYELTVNVTAQMDAAGQTNPTDDPAMRAAFLLANDLALLLLQRHIEDATGVDPLSTAGLQRWATIALGAYTDGVFVPPHPE